jgi:hypothetical protein
MRWTLWILAAHLLLAASAFAAPRLYLGLNGHLNNPTGDFAGKDLSMEQGGAKTGLGGELDLGIIGNNGSVYLGYSSGVHSASAAITVAGYDITADGDWTIKQWILGGRLNLLNESQSRLIPYGGAGVSLATATASLDAGGTWDGRAFEPISIDQTSGTTGGWFLEGGVLWKASPAADLLGAVQYHRFTASFDSDLYNGDADIAYVTFSVGVILRLRN